MFCYKLLLLVSLYIICVWCVIRKMAIKKTTLVHSNCLGTLRLIGRMVVSDILFFLILNFFINLLLQFFLLIYYYLKCY